METNRELTREELLQRIRKVKDICKIQSYNGNWDYDEYMRGLANGLILAVAILNEEEPKFFPSLNQVSSLETNKLTPSHETKS